MKKAFLTVFLLVLVVSVSYIKAVRQQEKVDKSFQLNVKSTPQNNLEVDKEADSLKISPLKRTSAQENDYSTKRQHELLAYYKKLYESLPQNLTDEEFKAAVSKIRQETAKKYSISVSELNRLREEHKVSF